MNKKLLSSIIFSLCSLVAASSAAFAATNDSTTNGKNFYVGLQTGRAHMNYSGSEYLLPRNSVEDKKWSNRLYLGYSFTDLLGMELGYNYFGRAEFKDNLTGNKQDMLQQGMDLSGKVTIPIDHGFGVSARAGLAWIHRDTLESRSNFFASKNSSAKIVPTGGVGINYNFNPAWSADLSVNGTMKSGDLPYSYFYGLGVSYKFGKDQPAY